MRQGAVRCWSLLACALLLVATLAAGAASAGAQEAPRVSPIVAEFNQAAQTTRYTILVAVPAGVTLQIKWSGPQCGTYASPSGEPTTFVWNHPHPPCDPTTGHQQTTVVVEVVAALQQFRCTYQGAESGAGPACTVTALRTQERTATAAAATSTPQVTRPVDEPDEAGSGFGLSLGLGLGVLVAGGAGVYVYTRSRKQEDAGTQWDRAMQAEDRAQQAMLTPFDMLLDRVNGAFAAYRSAVDRYRSAYSHAMSGSTEMQGMLSAWATAKEGAAKADLAFAVLTLAWGMASLGLKIARWATTARTVAAAGEAAVAGGQAAATAGKTAKGLEFLGKYTELVGNANARAMERLAAEAGVNVAEWTARYGDDAVLAGEELVKLVARMRGWHGVPDRVAGVVGRLLVNGQSSLTGRGVMAAEDIAELSRWSQRPGFWEWLAKSADWFEEIGWMGNFPEMNRYATLLWSADDIAFLRKVVEAGGDVSKLRALLGPAQTAVVGAVGAAPAIGGTGILAGGAGAAGLSQGLEQATSQLHDPLMQVGDLSNFVDQFGVTDRFTSGQGYGRAVMGELWELVTAPVTTIESHYFTHQA